MQIGEIRKEIDSQRLSYGDLLELGYDDNKNLLIPEEDVHTMLDMIESKISDIRYMLEDITGLSEIEDIKIKIKDLEHGLY